jgi:hypothetical protein
MSQPAPNAPTPLPKRRLQFSLATLLSSVVALGAVMGLWFANRDNARLRGEVNMLRERLGFLVVEDPSKIYARMIKADESESKPGDPTRWKFRIYAPKGSYRVGCQDENVPCVGINRSRARYERIGPGEGELELTVSYNTDWKKRSEFGIEYRGDKFRGGGGSGSGPLEIPPGFEPHSLSCNCASNIDVDTRKSYSFTIDEPVFLNSWKWETPTKAIGSDGERKYDCSSEPGPGLLVWFERDPEEKIDASR